VPPFQLLGLTFGIAFAVSLLLWGWLARCDPARFRRLFRQPPQAWLLGIAGLFGYHALFFTALDHAAAVQASLICFLWPLLLVLLSACCRASGCIGRISRAARSALPAPRCWFSRSPTALSASLALLIGYLAARWAAPSPGRSIR
jgi:drug/metabolite transporter (DMT)-like permease